MRSSKSTMNKLSLIEINTVFLTNVLNFTNFNTGQRPLSCYWLHFKACIRFKV